MGIGGYDGGHSRINVTPLIDVLLVLLVIFIMVAPVVTTAVTPQLPLQAESPLSPEDAERQLVVHVAADGGVRLNREDLERADLPGRLREVLARRGGERVVFLDAADGARYGAVVEVMDLCRDGGAEAIGAVPDSIGARP
jgi:biopolymer transport protein ExbD